MDDHDWAERAAARIERAEQRIERERMERIDAHATFDGRLSQVTSSVDALRGAVATTANKVGHLVAKLQRIEDDRAVDRKANDEQVGRVMAELGKYSARFSAQDTTLATIRSETSAQTAQLTLLVQADADRAKFEAWSKAQAKERSEADERRSAALLRRLQTLGVLLAILSALAGGLGWVVLHFHR